MNKIFFLLLLHFFCVFVTSTDASAKCVERGRNNKEKSITALPTILYTVQIKSAQTLSELALEIKRLSDISVPNFITKFTKDNHIFYRLRIGYFSDSIPALMFSRIIGYSNVWITRETTKDAQCEVLSNISADTISTIPSFPFYYISEEKSFIAIYQRNYGIEATALPSTLKVYVYGQTKFRIVNEVTGFFEKNGSLFLGLPLLVEKNPAGVNLNNLIQFSNKIKIPRSIADSSYSLFNNGTELRLNLLHEMNLSSGSLKSLNIRGIDWVDSLKNHKHWQNIDSKQLGNANMVHFSDKTLMTYSNKKIFLLSQHDEPNNKIIVLLCSIK
jgi:hypothetical protein